MSFPESEDESEEEVIDLSEETQSKAGSQKDKTKSPPKESSQKSEKVVKRDNSGKYKSTKVLRSASAEKRSILAAHSYSGTPSTSTSTPKAPKQRTQTAKSKSLVKTKKQEKGVKRKKVCGPESSSEDAMESDKD